MLPCAPPRFYSAVLPLCGSAEDWQRQCDADCRDIGAIAQQLRRTALTIHPLVQRLSCKNQPLAVLECCTTLTALAEELEQDDIPAIQDKSPY
ncbi:hypothetical protein [Acetobacter cibinongensis]|uniref:Uncharacterized protein n=1 Tax=Acetobacter cibinongensis TaxID=146475 RepID=A0A1Z5YRE6_9PROT|nr:hypothetical protein [Acetobacter cibinongensis]OUI98912.1 hypothetical protein HK14_15070 [Acetobacter cibinongensis]